MASQSSFVPQCTHEDDDVDDQFTERTIVCGASTKGSFLAVSTDNKIHKELLDPSEESYTKMLCHIIDKIYLIHLELEHDRELDCFYVDPKDIKDMVIGNWWLDIWLLQVSCA